MKLNKSITRTFFSNMILIAFIPIISIGVFVCIHTNNIFNDRILKIQNNYMSNQKLILRYEVKKIHFFIQNLIKHSRINSSKSLQDIELEILKIISSERFGKEGYFFGSTLTGDPLFSNGVITIGSSNILDLTDANGIKIIESQIEIANNPEGGFVEYSWKKLKGNSALPKISFVLKIPELNWIIGAGVYIDEIEKLILKEKRILNKKVNSYIIGIIGIFILVIFVISVLANHFSRKIKKHFEIFELFIKKSRKNFTLIDENKIVFSEFKSLARSANSMVEIRNELDEKLQEHRNHLEKIVKERTAKLKESNKNLQKYNELFMGRELRMKELKEKLKKYEKNQ